jgi:hypothetical protein
MLFFVSQKMSQKDKKRQKLITKSSNTEYIRHRIHFFSLIYALLELTNVKSAICHKLE